MDSLIGAEKVDPNANENHSHLEFEPKKKPPFRVAFSLFGKSIIPISSVNSMTLSEFIHRFKIIQIIIIE